MADIGEIVRVVVKYSQPNASETLNVFWFKITDNAPSDEQMVGDFEEWVLNEWGGPWADFAASDVSVERFDIDIINPDGTVDRNIGGTTVTLAGTVLGDVNSAADSGYIMAYTALPKSRGSKYVPGLADTDVVNNLISSEAFTDLLNLVAVFLAVYVGIESGAEYSPGVLRRAVDLFELFQDSGYVTDVPAYQRRRKLGVGS